MFNTEKEQVLNTDSASKYIRTVNCNAIWNRGN